MIFKKPTPQTDLRSPEVARQEMQQSELIPKQDSSPLQQWVVGDFFVGALMVVVLLATLIHAVTPNGRSSTEIVALGAIAQEIDTQETNTQETDTQETNTQETDTQETNTQETNTQETDTQEPDTAAELPSAPVATAVAPLPAEPAPAEPALSEPAPAETPPTTTAPAPTTTAPPPTTTTEPPPTTTTIELPPPPPIPADEPTISFNPGSPIATIPTAEQWENLRQCESNGNYTVIDRSGTYHGAYQFDIPTWRSEAAIHARHLLDTLPSDATPAEQDLLAQTLYERRGWRPWPICGARHLK